MRTRYKAIESEPAYFTTSTVVEWIPVFTSHLYCGVIIASGENFPQVMRDFKSYTAREIIKAAQAGGKDWFLNQMRFYKRLHKTGSEHQVWQEGFHPQAITTGEMLVQKIEYIHNNPLRRGLVERPEHWSYSSASNYIAGSGRLEVEVFMV